MKFLVLNSHLDWKDAIKPFTEILNKEPIKKIINLKWDSINETFLADLFTNQSSNPNYSPLTYLYNSNTYYFDAIIFDIETSETQLIVGFYLTSIQYMVQIVIHSDDSEDSIELAKNLIKNFLNVLTKQCQSLNSKDKLEGQTIPLLIGFNNCLYDTLVIQEFLTVLTITDNPVLAARKMSNKIIKTGGKGIRRSSFLFEEIFQVDLHWTIQGQLKKIVNMLVQTEAFPLLKNKSFSKPKGNLTGLKLDKWLEYNANDLIATFYLGLYSHRLFNYFLKAYNQKMKSQSREVLCQILQDRSFMETFFD